MNTIYEYAKYYNSVGITIIPIVPFDKKPFVKWKKYRINKNTDEEIDKWFKNKSNKEVGIGIVLKNSLICLDFDAPELLEFITGESDFNKLDTWVARTRKGYHVYFYADDIKDNIEISGVYELKVSRRYVIAPPSIHEYGMEYKWLSDITKKSVYRLNDKSKKLLIERSNFLKKNWNLIEILKKAWTKGNRNQIALYTSGALRKSGWKREDVENIIWILCLLTNDEEEINRLDVIKYTWEKDVSDLAGLSKLSELLSNEDIKVLSEILNMNGNRKKHNKKQTFSTEVISVAKHILKNEDPINYIVNASQKIHLGDEDVFKTLYLSCLSPEIYPIHVGLFSKSGSGKSDCFEVALEFLPSEYKFSIDDLSEKALFYMAKDGYDFNGSVIYIDDVDEKNISVLKTITGLSRNSKKHVTVIDQRSVSLEINGKFATWFSKVTPIQDEDGQLARRVLYLSPNESEEHDKKVVDFIINKRRLGIQKDEIPKDFEVIKCMTQIIKNDKCKVLKPLCYDFPHTRRSDVEIFSSFIDAVCKIYKEQRLRIKDFILAEPEDYEIAYNLWIKFEKMQSMKIDNKAMMIYDSLPDNPYSYGDDFEDNRMTVKDISEKLKLSPVTIKRKLRLLYDAGLIDYSVALGRGKPYSYWKFSKKLNNNDKKDNINNNKKLFSFSNGFFGYDISLSNIKEFFSSVKNYYKDLEKEIDNIRDLYIKKIFNKSNDNNNSNDNNSKNNSNEYEKVNSNQNDNNKNDKTNECLTKEEMELIKIPFKAKGNNIKKTDWIYYISLELHKLTPNQARILIDKAIKLGVVVENGEYVFLKEVPNG